jgi:hypothetical protein
LAAAGLVLPVGHGPVTSPAGAGVWNSGMTLLAQASAPSFDPLIDLFGKLFLVVGAVAIVRGGWMISRGEPESGLVSIIGGFVIALAIPIIRYFFSVP